MSKENLANRIAIITGAGQGMGKAVAKALIHYGAKVIVSDINADAAETTAKELCMLGGEAFAIQANVTDPAAVKHMVDTAIGKFGVIHILINNAGALRPTKVIDISEAEWDFIINTNLKGTFLCSQAILPVMIASNWGRIVNFSSTAGKSVSTIGGAHYTAAKTGILGFTRHLSREVARNGITVNAVCPGLIDTEMVRATIDEEKVSAYKKSFPISRLGLPEEVAELVIFLCSDNAAYITGASLDINGGDLTI